MSKTYRVRTQVGVDRQVNIELEQDFEQLEILSLKVRSEEVYTRMCADFGVIVGRVIANGGYGVPNVRVSVFVPLSEEDSTNEIISDLYPYTTIEDVNEDGYRYNLLPYEQQHCGHVPTGTFPSKNDVLTNPALIEVYDKYYKYTVKTNGSGDYMIMGVPTGSHTLVMDMDLSDIGPFSFSPQDLVRLGLGTADQFDGVNFKSSTNLFELPQIKTLNQSVEVQPFWGQPEICQINIARHDFDLRQAGIDILPTSTFMGSLITGVPDQALSNNCKPPTEMGDLCNLETGPGEIVAVRQTIFEDEEGLPILEQATLPRGGKLIDADGTWLFELPMNLDYVTTNEFGEQVFSQDPKVGVPTKSKYRFKIKYSQPSSFETEEVRRGYFLAPNIKEYGWVGNNDPAYNLNVLSDQYKKFQSSYYFGLSWSGYTNGSTGTEATQRLNEAINCEDRFYEFQYNKVYTISSLVDQYKKGTNRARFIGIKEITDSECASENNKFPATDGVRNFDLIAFLVNNVLLPIITPLLLTLLVVAHIIAFLYPILRVLINFVYGILLIIIRGICSAVNWLLPKKMELKCPEQSWILLPEDNPFKKITLPMLSYPDCQACDCTPEVVDNTSTQLNQIRSANSQNSASVNADFFMFDGWTDNNTTYQEVYAGFGINNETTRLPLSATLNQNGNIDDYYFIDQLPPWEIINNFNLKSSYFDGIGGLNSAYPGSNRIKVEVEPTNNPNKFHYDNVIVAFVDPDALTTLPKGQLLSFQEFSGSTDPNPTGFTSGNSTGITGKTNEGKSINVYYADPTNSQLPAKTITYNFPSTGITDKNYLFPSDLEYFQVITGVTWNSFKEQNAVNIPQTPTCNCITYVIVNTETTPITVDYTDCLGVSRSIEIGVDYDPDLQQNYGLTEEICACQGSITSTGNYTITFQTTCTLPSDPALVLQTSLYAQLSKSYGLYELNGTNGDVTKKTGGLSYLDKWRDGELAIVFMVRGVDPWSGRKNIKYDLSRIFGYKNYNNKIISGDFYLNIPVQPYSRTIRNNTLVNNTDSQLGIVGNNNSQEYLYYQSYQYSAGTEYTVYQTTQHLYYSSLDYDTVLKPFKINSNNFTLLLTPSMVIKDGGGGLRTANTVQFGYTPKEYIEGGSFIYYQNKNNISYPSLYFAPSWASETVKPKMFVYPSKLVMRSDRLPTGTSIDGVDNNVYAMQCSNRLPYVLISETGEGETVPVAPTFSFGDSTAGADVDDIGTMSSILTSFTCEGMVDLDCYQGDGSNFTKLPSDNACNKNEGGIVVKNGCYVLVNKAFTTLFGKNNDFNLLAEWVARFRLTFAICRGVFSHTFVNAWVNGSVFAFPFKTKVFFDGNNRPFVRRLVGNQIKYLFCGDVLTYNEESNNFYYRSSPWNGTAFIGKESPTNANNDVNIRNLLYPTTILDMGPKFIWTKDVVFSPEYYGYQMDKLRTTSWNSVDDLIQLFTISRLVNSNFLESIVGVGDGAVAGYFSRNEQRVDGDYAQMLQINSQYGIAPFNSENYIDDPTNPSQNPIFVGVDNNNKSLFGVFLSGNTQDSDLISPRRINRTITGSTVNFVGDYLGTKSQLVPMYSWVNYGWDNQSTIFGSEANTWATDVSDIKALKYQEIDRLKPPMFIGGTGVLQYQNGHIYNRNSPTSPTNPNGYITSTNNMPNNYKTITGAPWYFYFGLKTGKSAMDKFIELYIGLEE